jgi:hypothetical protein
MGPFNTIKAQDNFPKKLIELGWDYPKVSFLITHIGEMESKSPFDGVVFSFDADIFHSFDTIQFNDRFFQYNELPQINWKKFTDNFLQVRGAGNTGPHWLDDKSWLKITSNLRKISKSVYLSKARGIVFDPEYYLENPNLNPWIYNDSLYPSLSYQQVGKYVRKRGKQYIQALQTYKPDIKILCLWLLGLVAEQNNSTSLSKTGMALYPYFIAGMLEGKNDSSKIIDGNELSYWYQSPELFIQSGSLQKGNAVKYLSASLQSKFKNVSFAQAVFYDGIFAKATHFEKGFDKSKKERWFNDNLYLSFKTTDKYVWFYNERLDWWRGEVDPKLINAIKKIKSRVRSEYNDTIKIKSGQSFRMDFHNIYNEWYNGFKYSYSKKNRFLSINLLNNEINRLELYVNSTLISSMDNPKKDISFNLKNYSGSGNIIVLSKDKNGIYSVAFIN